MFSLHAPHSGHSQQDRESWWAPTEAILAPYPDAVIGIDANAAVGARGDSFGPAGASAPDHNGELLMAWAAKSGHWAPATFS
eukprot:2942653-Lingulodinium_polyedra.AAC.1